MQEVVSRWRAQTYNPDSAGYSIDEGATVETGQTAAAAVDAPAQQPRPSLRRDSFMSPQIGAPLIQPAPQPSGFGKMTPAAVPLQPAPAPAQPEAQQSLASLIKQFRT